MKILVISFNDSDNLAIENVLYELVNRGHTVTIFAIYEDENSLRMFKNIRAEIRNISELNQELVKEYDIAFCSNMAMDKIKLYDIYCFVYTSYLDDTFVTDGADFLFLSRDLQVKDMDYKCASMVVGIPKNDRMKKLNSVVSNRILYIDSGHIPFGKQGRVEIADTILEICNRFPQYEICIKPRWLREGEIRYTHKNLQHIYDIIEERCNNMLPSNLNMLTEHYDLQELIDSSMTVITLFSASHLDVIQRERGLLILSGWSNEDKFDMRNKNILQRQGDLYKKSGCVINYKDVINYLPYGLHASSDYKKTMLPYIGGASKKIAEVMEYVFLNFVSENRFPQRTKYIYDSFKEEIVGDPLLTMDILKRERIKAILQQRCHMLKIKIDAPIAFDDYFKYIDNEIKTVVLNEESVKSLYHSAFMLRNKIIINHYSIMMNDSIDQSILLRAYYDIGNAYKIMEIDLNDILCRGSYFFYLAMIHKKEREFNAAVQNFVMFLNEVISRTYDKYPQESNWGMQNAYNCIFRFYDRKNISEEMFAKIYCYLYENGLEDLVEVNNRKKVYNYIPSLVVALRNENPELSYRLSVLWLRIELSNLKDDYNRLNCSLSCRIGFGLTWIPRKMRKVYGSICQNGFKVLCKEFVKKSRNCFLQQHIFQIWSVFYTKVLRGFSLYLELLNKYGNNTQLILSAPATGDAYVYGMMFQPYICQKYGDKKCVFGVFGNSSITVAQLFSIKNIVAYNMEQFRHLYNLSMFSDMVNIDSMHYHIFYRQIGILSHLEGIHNYNWFSESLDYLNLHSKKILTKPIFKCDNEFLSNLFNNGLVVRRTIVLAPYAKTVKSIPMYFWIQLTERLKEKGFSVCTNSIGETEPPIYGTTAVFIPYDQSVPFVEMAGAVIGLRSGFLDVISSAKCLKISLCNENNYKRGICHISESFSLSAMYEEPDQYDFLYSAETSMDLLDQLVRMVSDEFDSEERNERKAQYE